MNFLCILLFCVVCISWAADTDGITSITTRTSTSTITSVATSTTTIPSIFNHAEIVSSSGETTAEKDSSTSAALTKTSKVSTADNTGSTSYTSDSDFESSIIVAHNFFRDEHNATNLTWNSTSAAYAAAYAAKCVFVHSGGPTGENLAAGYVNVTAAVNAWGLEREKYNFDAPGFSETTGHFTQVVWKATTTVGCGRFACDGNGGTSGYYIMCEYYPPGNVDGEFQVEVDKLIKGNIDVGFEAGSDSTFASNTAKAPASASTVTYIPTSASIPTSAYTVASVPTSVVLNSDKHSGYGWLVGIVVGIFANIAFVVMLVWKLS